MAAMLTTIDHCTDHKQASIMAIAMRSILIGLCLCIALTDSRATNRATEQKWWESASLYQIYPRSFKDSDGDGVGDLRGIMEQLPYLKEIGITAAWLSPCFTSPMADFGYDIANFTEIDPIFGTMDDFDAMIARAKDVGVKIMLDFVPNHSSDESEWFKKSVANDPEYRDFYVWHPGKMVNGVRVPPTNWISVFRGSMWTWNDQRRAYYLHQFTAKQPDLNFRNPKVVETMREVLRFWLRRGVAGFRVDAVPHMFEVEADRFGNWPDEPRNPNVNDPKDYDYLLHPYTTNRPETTDMIYEFRKVLQEMEEELGGDERLLMTEAYAPLDVLMQHYGNDTVEGAQVPYNFKLITQIGKDSNAYDYAVVVASWIDNMPAGRVANWVMGNHDVNRLGSRMGEDRIDLFNILLSTLPGVSVTYQGEEIGMLDTKISWEDTVDPRACQGTPEELDKLSRDPERTPFQWNESKFAGFSDGNHTWLPVNENYHVVNVKRQRNIALSHLNIFKQVKSLRKTWAFSHGEAEFKALSENVLGIKRWYVGDYVYVVLFNFKDDVESVNLHSSFNDLTSNIEYVLVTDKSTRRVGDWAHTDSVLLMPKEAVVLRTTRRL